MKRNPLQFAYGIKLVALWMLIPFILFFIPLLAKEFSGKVTTQEVTLKEETYSGYPDEILCFKTDINGKERVIYAPVTSKTGDKVTVILRNGSYFTTAIEPDDLFNHATFAGRFLKVCNNNFGYHTVIIAAVLLLTFLITLRKSKEIRSRYRKLSKITDIGGMIICFIMSVTLIYGAVEGSLTGIGIAYLGLFSGIIYTAIFVIAWVIEWLIFNFSK
ncbi:MAG: hypothetical protein IKG30_00255 [Clostridiales bacterium]|nr:hypothetical protein [Clostridiales bacterium]